MKTPLAVSSAPERGAALVITLFFLVIITVMVVGFLDSSRIERSAAQSHLEKLRATNMASQGLEAVVATLRRETADPPRQSGETEDQYDQRRRNWTSQPGQLSVPEDPKPGANIDQKRLVKTVRLSSGAPSATLLQTSSLDPVLRPPNLNAQTLLEQDPVTYLIDDPQPGSSPVEMKLRWIYQREKPDANGSYFVLDAAGQPVEQPVLDSKNPIVGRFAYWADDESSKVNYNLAWTRDPKLNAMPPGHQTKIDLRALPLFDADATKSEADRLSNKLHWRIAPDAFYTNITRFFNTPFDARQTDDPAIRTALDRNKFNLTHYNSDPDTTYFGKERLVLTTKKMNAIVRDKDGKEVRTRPFLDILKPDKGSTDNVDPGMVNNLDPVKLSAVMDLLVNQYLKRADWPMIDAPGNSLQSKYYAGKQERLAQLALNIIDYVRSAESDRTIVEPIRGKYKGTVFTGDWSDTSLRGQDDSYKGLTRSFMITEMSAWVNKDPVTPQPAFTKDDAGKLRSPVYQTKLYVELYLPPNYGIPQVDLRNPLGIPGQRLAVYFWPCTRNSDGLRHWEPAWQRAAWKSPTGSEETFFIVYGPGENPKIPAGNIVGADPKDPEAMILKAGQYKTIVCEFYREKGSVTLRGAVATGLDANNNGRLDAGFNARYDVAPLGDAGAAATLNFALDPETTPEAAISSMEVDDPRVNGVASDWRRVARQTFNQPNSVSTLGKAPGAFVPEQDVDKNGLISAASLRMPFRKGTPENPNGRVRSAGDLGLIHTGIEGRSKGIGGGGVPWRTLHLQPSKQPSTVVPDWAFMDLFTVPADVPAKAAVLFAPRATSTGGRVNMNAEPVPFDLKRTDPLAAVLYGCRKFSDRPDLVTLKEARQKAANIYGRVRATAPNLPAGKPYPALKSGAPNVFESPGEVVEIAGIADEGEESEELVREIANLITARGNVFSVYTIGQALKQTPGGKLLVTGEQRQQAYLERYLVDKGNTDPNDDSIGFRTIYFRNLVP